MSSGAIGPGQPPSEEEPDAVARGSVQYAGGPRESALFVLAGGSLGVGRTDHPDPPIWIELQSVKGLDALGDTVDGVLEVEMALDDGRVFQASWPEAFCDRVVETLVGQADGGAPAPPAAPVAPPTVPVAPVAAEQFPPPEVVAIVGGSRGPGVPAVAVRCRAHAVAGCRPRIASRPRRCTARCRGAAALRPGGDRAGPGRSWIPPGTRAAGPARRCTGGDTVR